MVRVNENHKNYNFAFESIEDLLSWFPPAVLHHMNGKIISILIDDEHVIKYNKQVQYNPAFVLVEKLLIKRNFIKMFRIQKIAGGFGIGIKLIGVFNEKRTY